MGTADFDANYLLQVGKHLLAENRLNEAISVLTKVSLDNPGCSELHFTLFQAHSQIGQSTEAFNHFLLGTEIVPEAFTPQHYFEIAEKLVETGMLDQASACLSRALHLEPSFSKALRLFVKIARAQGKIDQMIAALESFRNCNLDQEQTYLRECFFFSLTAQVDLLEAIRVKGENDVQHQIKYIQDAYVRSEQNLVHAPIARNDQRQQEAITLLAEKNLRDKPLVALIIPNFSLSDRHPTSLMHHLSSDTELLVPVLRYLKKSGYALVMLGKAGVLESLIDISAEDVPSHPDVAQELLRLCRFGITQSREAIRVLNSVNTPVLAFNMLPPFSYAQPPTLLLPRLFWCGSQGRILPSSELQHEMHMLLANPGLSLLEKGLLEATENSPQEIIEGIQELEEILAQSASRKAAPATTPTFDSQAYEPLQVCRIGNAYFKRYESLM